ncbi:MAG: HAD-IB family phosphatase [Clostridia bacterium]|nr:HAD-IB family phosphatase [Clostridia bacterium]MBQ7788953.1 HAD-IB family phosphatase [Clostridia bacterium]
MNVFDFDGTIYHGDSSKDFFFYCVKKYPKMKKYLFKCAFWGIGFALRLVKKIKFKEKFFSFLKDVPNVDKAVEEFWAEKGNNMHKWYMEMKQPSDVIISASPEFLLEPICKRLGVECLIASPTDKHTGKFSGPNCLGEEKVKRFREIYPEAEIDEFYSDRYVDTPVAKIAKKAIFVKGEKLSPWKKFK